MRHGYPIPWVLREEQSLKTMSGLDAMIEKLIVVGIAAVIFGVTIVGANAMVGPMDTPAAGDTATLGMQSNASFLAPIPVNYSTVSMHYMPLPSPLLITRT